MAMKSRKIKPSAKRETDDWISDLISNYESLDGSEYDVGGCSEEWILNKLSSEEISIDFSIKGTGTNQDKPYLDIPDRRTVNNLIAELFMISMLPIEALKDNAYFADVWNVLHKTADPVNRVGKSQPWVDFLKGLIQDKIKYKRRNYNGKWQRYTNDLSLDQVLHLSALFALLSSNSDFKTVDFVEGL